MKQCFIFQDKPNSPFWPPGVVGYHVSFTMLESDKVAGSSPAAVTFFFGLYIFGLMLSVLCIPFLRRLNPPGGVNFCFCFGSLKISHVKGKSRPSADACGEFQDFDQMRTEMKGSDMITRYRNRGGIEVVHLILFRKVRNRR